MHVAILGSGKIGATLARRLTAAGHEVTLANSRGPASLEGLVEELGPRAGAATDAAAAARAGEVVVLALPFHLYDDLPAAELEGKVVVDAMNYYPGRDGRVPPLDEDRTTSSELVADQLPGARVVKAFNTMLWTRLGEDGRPPGAPDRLVLFLAGDDADAKATVAALADDIGFDTLDTGGLATSRRQQPGAPVYGAALTLAQATAPG